MFIEIFEFTETLEDRREVIVWRFKTKIVRGQKFYQNDFYLHKTYPMTIWNIQKLKYNYYMMYLIRVHGKSEF